MSDTRGYANSPQIGDLYRVAEVCSTITGTQCASFPLNFSKVNSVNFFWLWFTYQRIRVMYKGVEFLHHSMSIQIDQLFLL